MKKIVYTDSSGGLCVIHPVINNWTLIDGEIKPVSEAILEGEALQRAHKDIPADATNVQIVDEIPKDRTFRNAWMVDGKVVTHDMGKCRDIHKQRLRELRAPKLAALDVEYQRADEEGNAQRKRDIATQKKALRDATEDAAILAAKTPDELKLAIPEVLK